MAGVVRMEHEGREGRGQGHEEDWSITEGYVTSVVDAGLKVHRALGPGLLESAYENCLAREFLLRGLAFERQVAVPLTYEGLRIDVAYRLDLIVAGSVVVEVKAADMLNKLHEAQLLTYLRLTGCRVGLLMNFNVVLFKQGLRRLVR